MMTKGPKNALFVTRGYSDIIREGLKHRHFQKVSPYFRIVLCLVIIGARTLAKRAIVYEILKQSGRLRDFLNNPQLFIEKVTECTAYFGKGAGAFRVNPENIVTIGYGDNIVQTKAGDVTITTF